MANSLAHCFGGCDRVAACNIMSCSFAAPADVARRLSEGVRSTNIQMGKCVLIQASGDIKTFFRLKCAIALCVLGFICPTASPAL